MMYQNCGQKSFQFAADDTLSKVSPTNLDGGGTPGSGDGSGPIPVGAFGPGIGNTNLTPEEFHKLCPVIAEADRLDVHMMAPAPIPKFVISGSGNTQILGNIGDLSIVNTSGNVVAKADLLSEISGMSGNARIAAQHANNISDVSGNICLSTNSIGDISGGQSGNLDIIGPKDGPAGPGGNIKNRSGNTYISNLNFIDIQASSGNLQMVGGAVQTLEGDSGNIILDNVQVGTLTTGSGNVILKNGASAQKVIRKGSGNLIQE